MWPESERLAAELRALPYRRRWKRIEELLATEDDQAWHEAFWAIDRMRGRRMDARIRALASSGPEWRRCVATREVAYREGFGAVDFLVGLLQDDSAMLRDDVVDVLGDVLQWSNRHSRFAEVLGILGGALQDPSPEVRWTACFSLGKSRTRRALPYLRTAEKDPSTSKYGDVAEIARVARRHILYGEPLEAGYMLQLAKEDES